MYLVKSRQLDEANEKALTPVCSVQVQKIFALLHAKALSEGENAGSCKIENTAADGNDAKMAVFHSAGEHMIVARSAKDGEKIDFKSAKEGLLKYVSVFCGEDISKGIKDDEILPLRDEDKVDNNGADGDSDSTEDEETNESVIPSFSMFLSETAGIKVMLEAGGDEEDSDEAEEQESAGDDDSAEDDEDSDEAGDDDEDDAGADGEDSSEGGEDDDDSEGGDSEGDGQGGEDKDGENPDKASGWYILYGLKIKGLKETTVTDALKQWGSNFLKGFGVKIDSLWGPGGSGEVHTIGGLVHGLKGIFGAIDDPDELQRRVGGELRKKFPQLREIDCNFRDKKTLVRELDKKSYSEGWPDGKNKQKINGADYSMCIHVKGDDLREPFINRKVIANTVTMQIKGLFKKFKNLIKADDVIYLRGDVVDGNDNGGNIRKVMSRLWTPSVFLQELSKASKKEVGFKEDGSGTIKFQEGHDEAVKKHIGTVFGGKDDCKEYMDSILKIWDDFYKKFGGKAVTKKGFEDDFLNKYKKEYEKMQKAGGTRVEECSAGCNDEQMFTAYDMLTEMFGDTVGNHCVMDVFEDEYIDESKIGDYIEQNKLTKDQALSDEHFGKIKKIGKLGDDKAKQKIEQYFSSKSSGENTGSGKTEREDNPGQDVILSATKRPRIKTENPEDDGKVNRISDDFHMANQAIGQKIAGMKVDQFDGFAPVRQIEKWLKYYGLSDDFTSKIGDHKFAFMLMLKTPKTQSWRKKKDGSQSKPTLKSSWGYEAYNESNVKKAMEDALGKDGKLLEFFKFKAKTANANFPYNETKVPADTEVYAGFVDEIPGSEQPGEIAQMYFVVTEKPLEPSPDQKVVKWLNDGKPVKKDEVDSIISQLQEEAEAVVEDESLVSESLITEEGEDGEDDAGDDDESGDGPKVTFDSWVPDPHGEVKVNGKGADGKDAIIICAKFKKDDPDKPKPGGDEDSEEPEPIPGEQGGDDMYIIPMPGVTFEKGDENDMKGAEFER